MEVKNVFSLKDIPVSKQDEFSQVLASGHNLRIERIVSTGQVSPPDFWYQQKENEWVVLLQGRATLEFENNSLLHLQAGDSMMLPAGIKHRVAYTSKHPACVWIAVFF